MHKSFHDNRICLVFESLEEAARYLSALATHVPFYTEHKGTIYEIQNISNVTITLIADADVREVSAAQKQYTS